MKNELIIIFIILLLGFILFSFLGNQSKIENFSTNSSSSNNDNLLYNQVSSNNNFDNYNHYTGKGFASRGH